MNTLQHTALHCNTLQHTHRASALIWLCDSSRRRTSCFRHLRMCHPPLRWDHLQKEPGYLSERARLCCGKSPLFFAKRALVFCRKKSWLQPFPHVHSAFTPGAECILRGGNLSPNLQARFCKLSPVAGSNLLLEKVSDSPNFFSEFVFPNSVFLCSFLGLWSGFVNPQLQSLVNQYFPIFSQPIFFTNIWTALFEKETWKDQPPRSRCSKMPRIWKDKSTEMSCVHFARLLDLLWHYLKK